MYVCIHIYICSVLSTEWVDTCIHIHVYTYMYTHTCIHIHVYTYMYTHTCIHIHVYTYMYKVPVPVSVPWSQPNR